MPLFLLTFITIVFLCLNTSRAQELEPKKPDAVVLVHGLGRGPLSMLRMEKHLRSQGYETLSVSYPSRKKPIEELLTDLETQVSERFPDKNRTIHFVTHSLGGILVRMYVPKNTERDVGRVVMLAPPNQGSDLPDTFKGIGLYRWITGPAGLQLGTDDNSVPNILGPADFECGIIAGGRTLNPLYSAFIEGKDDGKVSVEQTQLDGMQDFVTVKSSHTWIMNRKFVLSYTSRFIETGCFD